MTLIIVFGSILAYLLIGLTISRPYLPHLYATIRQRYLDAADWDRHRHAAGKDPERIARQVAIWYVFVSMLWPISALWSMSWFVVRTKTPQLREHRAQQEADRLAIELAEANKIIAEYGEHSE